MKGKRILALIGVILLLSLFAILIYAAFTATPESNALLKASLFTIIVLPIMIYACILFYRLIKKKNEENDNLS